MTNFEKIKAMSADEMADFIGRIVAEMDMCNRCPAYDLQEDVCMTCKEGIKAWLESRC